MNIVVSYASYRFTDAKENVGGEERVAWGIVTGLVSRGHTVFVFSPKIELSKEYEGIVPEIITGCDFKSEPNKIKLLFKLYRFARLSRSRIKKLLAKKDIDIIHHIRPAYPGFSSSVYDLSVPFVYGPVTIPYKRSIEGRERKTVFSRLYKTVKQYFYNRTLKNAEIILLQVPAVKQFLPQQLLYKTKVLYNAVNTKEYRPSKTPGMATESDTHVQLLYHGGLRANKGIAYLIRALKRLSETESNPPQLTLIGKLMDESLPGLVRELGVEHLVNFSGMVSQSQIPSSLDRNAIYIFPALQDSFSAGLIEAMVMGLPVITTDVYDLPNIVRHEKEGLIVEPGDEQQLAQALKTLLRDKKKREEYGLAARKRAIDMFDLEKRLDELEEIYRSSLHKKSDERLS